MKTIINYVALGLSVILLILSLVFFNKYNSLVDQVESSAELSYKSFITETKNYQSELNNFIVTKKSSNYDILVKDANTMRSAFQNYELFVSTIFDSQKKIYNERTELFLKIINTAPDFSNASIQELQNYSNLVEDTIKLLENTK